MYFPTGHLSFKGELENSPETRNLVARENAFLSLETILSLASASQHNLNITSGFKVNTC